jgi:altronate hydrolase/altronate dehydratase small subunit
MPQHDMLALHADDDVAVALRDLPPGPVRVSTGGAVETLVLRAAIPLGHKAARRDLPQGHHVRKYGAAIGEATAPIAAGDHAHVHNIRSLRARRTEPTT